MSISRIAMIGLLLMSAVTSFGYRHYIRAHTSEAAKRGCAREPIRFFDKNQYSNCLARQM
jgi:hypothetical protein